MWLQNKLRGWWHSLRGTAGKTGFARVRRGGPWNKELELYYSLLEEKQVGKLEENEVVLHQANVDVKADTVCFYYTLQEENFHWNLNLPISYFADGKFAKFKFRLLLYF